MAVLLLLVLLMLLSGWYVEYGVFVIARTLLLLVTWLGLAAEYGCCWLVEVVEEEEVQEEASCAPQLSLALALVALVVVVVVAEALLLLLLLVVAVTAGDLLLVDDEVGDCNV